MGFKLGQGKLGGFLGLGGFGGRGGFEVWGWRVELGFGDGE